MPTANGLNPSTTCVPIAKGFPICQASKSNFMTSIKFARKFLEIRMIEPTLATILTNSAPDSRQVYGTTQSEKRKEAENLDRIAAFSSARIAVCTHIHRCRSYHWRHIGFSADPGILDDSARAVHIEPGVRLDKTLAPSLAGLVGKAQPPQANVAMKNKCGV